MLIYALFFISVLRNIYSREKKNFYTEKHKYVLEKFALLFYLNMYLFKCFQSNFAMAQKRVLF